jgi:hypothetical protein
MRKGASRSQVPPPNSTHLAVAFDRSAVIFLCEGVVSEPRKWEDAACACKKMTREKKMVQEYTKTRRGKTKTRRRRHDSRTNRAGGLPLLCLCLRIWHRWSFAFRSKQAEKLHNMPRSFLFELRVSFFLSLFLALSLSPPSKTAHRK